VPADDLRRQPFERRAVGDVERHALGGVAFGGKRRGDHLRVIAARGGHDTGALPREPLGNGAPDAAGRAGDQRDFPGEVKHAGAESGRGS
jgi:hypothetical protein